MADLDEIMSGPGGAMPESEQPTTQQDIPVEPPQAPQGEAPATPSDGPNGGMVPIQAVEDERAKRRKYTDEVAELNRRFSDVPNLINTAVQQAIGQFIAQQQPRQQQPPPPAPDFYQDPDAAFDHRLQGAISPLVQSQQAMREGFSRMMAVDKHGEETVNAAFAAMRQAVATNPAAARFDYERIMAAPHPFGELVNWHRQRTALSEIGDDPAAFRERIRQEVMAELQAQPPAAQPQQQPGAQPPMPTSFAAARSAGPRTAPQWSGPAPLSEIMKR